MAETYTVYWGTISGSLSLVAGPTASLTEAVPVSPLEYDTTYYWRVDATNDEGTTTGDEWHFTTLVFAPPSLGLSAGGPTKKRLIAAANNKIWYESTT